MSGVFVPSLTLQDSLLVNNTNHGFSVYTGSTGNKDTITYSALYGNTGTATSGRVTVGTGCLTTVSPTFYSTDSTSPYYLYLASTCPSSIKTGSSTGGYMGAFGVVPEPGTAALSLLAGGCTLWFALRRRRGSTIPNPSSPS